MAGISIGNQLDLRTRLPLDSRHLFHTIEEMVAFPDNFLPEIFFCQNEEEPNVLFVFNKQNELDEIYGKWRRFKSGDKVEIADIDKLGIVSIFKDGGILLEDGRLYLENQENLKQITSEIISIITQINQEDIDNFHTHDNKSVLDTITSDKLSEIHTHENKDVIDTITEEHIGKIIHDNRDVLDKLSKGEKGLLYDGKDISGVSAWGDITDKPFESIDSDNFEVINDVLKIKESGQTTQVTTLPTANSDNENVIYQYVGDDTDTCKNGYFYKCMLVDGIYKWANVKVQPDTELGDYVLLSELETHAKSTLHITSAERNLWNSKPNKSDIPTKLVHLTEDAAQVEVLNRIGENEDGQITYNGQLVASGVLISSDEGNIIENRENGLYSSIDLTPYAKSNDVIAKNTTRTEAAIDEAIKSKHVHANKEDVLDKLGVSDEKLTFNGLNVSSNVDISSESDNGLQLKDDGLFVDISAHHSHDNKVCLDKISESNGEFTYDGKTIETKISAEDGNAISLKSDGLYVSTTGVKISSDSENIIQTSANDNGLYATIGLSTKEDNNISKDAGKLYSPKTKISALTDNAISDNDGLYVKKVVPSSESGNALVQRDDGSLYVASGSVEISQEPNQALVSKDDGLYVREVTLSEKSDNVLIKDGEDLYVPKHKDLVQSVNNVVPDSSGNIKVTLDSIDDGTKRKLYDLETTGLTVDSLWI